MRGLAVPTNVGAHLSDETLHALHLGVLGDAEANAALRHMDGCPACRQKLVAQSDDPFLARLRDFRTQRETPSPNETASWAEPAGAAPPSSPTAFPAPFGRYRLLKVLGRGGMGSVYLALDTQLDRRVALKVPHFGAADGPQMLERFFREARAAATLRHPNICPLYDVGEVDGTPYLTMAFIEGKPLARVAAARPLTARQAAAVVRKIALALEEAHRRGVIHRDLKPENVMLDPRGEPIVTDFGLARRAGAADVRLTQQGAVVGTPAYMSPEQVGGRADAVGPASDVYSLGVIFYELLTGRLPFTGDVMAVFAQVLMDEPPKPTAVRPGLEPELEAICLRAMAKKAEDRFGSMAELAAAVTAVLRTKPAAAAIDPPGPTPPAPPEPDKDPGLRVSQMGGLRSMAMAYAGLPARKAPAAKKRPRPSRSRRVPVWGWVIAAGTAAAAVLVGVLVAGTLRVKTTVGTIVVEHVPADAKVEVDGQTVTLTRNGDVVTVTPSGAGRYRLKAVVGGKEVWADEAVVTLGGEPVHLTVVPPPPPPPPEVPHPPPSNAPPFFDARNLAANWDGRPGYWHVEGGALVGRPPENEKPGTSTFLVSKREYTDFVLKFRVRRTDGVGNSGVQFRSQVKDPDKFVVVGPQCEIESAGAKYPPGSLVSEPDLKPFAEKARAEVARQYRDADFNDYSIRCVGKHLTVTVNGVVAIDNTYPALPDSGVIAWQIHGKQPPREIVFRDIEFTDLGRGAPAGQPGGRRDDPPATGRDEPPGGEKADKGKFLHLLRTHPAGSVQNAYTASFSPDSRTCLISRDRSTHLYDVITGHQVADPMKPYVAEFVAARREIVTAQKHPPVLHVYDFRGHQLREFAGRADIWNMKASPRGDRTLVDTADGFTLYDAANFREVRRWPCDPMKTFKFYSPDGHHLLQLVDGHPPWRVYRTETGHESKAFEKLVGIERLRGFFPDGRRAYGWEKGTFSVYDVKTGEKVKELDFEDPGILAVTLSPDGKRVLVAHVERQVSLWDVATGRKVCTFSTVNVEKVHRQTLSFSPDGRYACAGGAPGNVYLWQLPPSE